MSNFFKSEMVRGDIQEMAQLQEFCMRSMVAFPVLNKTKKLQYFDVLEQLIEKQKIFHARVSLSDDPEAIDMAETMRQGAVLLGAMPNQSLGSMYDDLLERINEMRYQLDAQEY